MTTVTIKEGKNKVRRVVYDEDGEEGGLYWADYISTFHELLLGMGFLLEKSADSWTDTLQDLEDGLLDVKTKTPDDE